MTASGTGFALAIDLCDEDATRRLAEDIALALRAGDVVALAGDLGAGKTTLARAILRTLADDPDLEVPSPTFTLVQDYPLRRFAVFHFDLYRIGSPEDLVEIGFDEACRSGAVLVEWPDKAGDLLPADALRVDLSEGAGPDGRRARLSAPAGRFSERLARSAAIRDFLAGAGWGGAARRYLQGDASTRAYERVRLGEAGRILMDQPAEADDEAGRSRVAALRAAKLAEDTRPFHAFALGLAACGFSVPEIHAHDPERGFMLIEDLGREVCIEGDPPAPVRERYRVAVEVLAALHGMDLPTVLPDGTGGTYAIPRLERRNLVAEVTILLDWGIPYLLGRPTTGEERESFLAVWEPLFDEILAGPATWCLRDYHSPNILWLPEREGLRRLGILDFQDAALGHPAYDVASLAQDARITVPAEIEAELLAHYVALRAAADPAFDAAAFRRAYMILAAQRSTRLVGQFVRLLRRDGKPGYMRHYPRLWEYLGRILGEEVLRPLKLWYDARVPEAARSGPGA
ncbi:tRNA (adenosine(37)-N6)-threonylcarbamoyltransferase complex ATPase subunit type 1 TsaE [Prosthecomicrobium sp. N25]|uniref:tRNA (adenosine(37)-N6)-threonylcarbamoyltransferase complex ATPase subunit type 1 TsaE n=1 Tax=Prosthecomicrobium sp. N25 TaxID=3129254 RepID=UPI0030769AA3